MILILAGTTEGRVVAQELQRQGLEVLVATATAYGCELLSKAYQGPIIAGQLTLKDLLNLIREKKINRVIDAAGSL